MTNEELDIIVTQALDNNVVIYAEDRQTLIDIVYANLFRIGESDMYDSLNKFGIECVISNDVSPFKDEHVALFDRVLISESQRIRMLVKFKDLGGIWPSSNCSSKVDIIPEWCFFFKTSWGQYYIAATRKE